jgi:hypothetical protein
METDAVDIVGGLSIPLNPNSILLENFFTSNWSISTSFRVISSNKKVFLTNVYGPVTQRDKEPFMQNLEWIGNHIGNNHWILGGEFKFICNLEEKKGGIKILDNDNIHFQSMIYKMRLIDIKTQKGPCTWTNIRSNIEQVSFQLDRFLISEHLMMDGLKLNSNFLDATSSDHWPI